jgi:hypothetical protein
MSIEAEETITSKDINALQGELYSQVKRLEEVLKKAGKGSMLYLPPEVPQDPIVTARLTRVEQHDNPILSVGIHPLSGPPETYKLCEIHTGFLFVTSETDYEGDLGIVQLQRLTRLLSQGKAQIFEEDNIHSIQSQQGVSTIPPKHSRGMKPSKIQYH